MFIGYVAISQTAMPNGEFENWQDVESPESWDASNIHDTYLGFPVNIITVEQSNDSYSGNFSVRMQSMQIMTGFPISPGFITLGTFWYSISPQDGGASGGIPFTERPDSISGYYKSTVTSGDYTSVHLDLWNSNGTVGTAIFQNGNSVADWTYFSAPIDYANAETPDSINIIISSSDFYNQANIKNGSTLYLDDLSFVYNGVSIRNVNFNQNVIVGAGNENIFVKTNFAEPIIAEISLFTISGQLVLSLEETLESSKLEIPVVFFNSGNYILSISDRNGFHFSQQIVIQ